MKQTPSKLRKTAFVRALGQMCFVLGLIAAFALSTVIGAAWAAETVGTVAKQRMDAYGTPPGEDRARKYPRYDVVYGELIETSGGGAILIRMADKTELYLGERASLTIDEFVYDPKTNASSAVFNFTLGTLRFVSGQMDDVAITIQTPNTNIGIRGSEAIIFVTPEGETIVNVTKGRFSVRSRESPDAPAVAVQAGENVSVSGVDTFSNVGAGIKMPEYDHSPDSLMPDYSDDLQYLKTGGGFDKAREGSRDPGGREPGDHSDPGGHHDAKD